MSRPTFRFAFPERFVAGTIGQPGDRTFFLQARDAGRMTSVRAEKQQVQALADSLERILDELSRLTHGSSAIPPHADRPSDMDPLDVPLDEEFRVGTMTISWDSPSSAVVIELFAADEDDQDDRDTGGRFGAADALFGDPDDTSLVEAMRVSLSPDQAREFAARARLVVSAGRPACPFCGQPVGAEGHICPRSNGYRPAQFG